LWVSFSFLIFAPHHISYKKNTPTFSMINFHPLDFAFFTLSDVKAEAEANIQLDCVWHPHAIRLVLGIHVCQEPNAKMQHQIMTCILLAVCCYASKKQKMKPTTIPLCVTSKVPYDWFSAFMFVKTEHKWNISYFIYDIFIF